MLLTAVGCAKAVKTRWKMSIKLNSIGIEGKEEIRRKLLPNTFIIVEGKRDKQVLEKLNFKNIIQISGKSNERLLERIKHKKIKRAVVLTDFDREGEKRHKELCRIFEKNGIKVDAQTRKKFRQNFNIRKIEELSFITKHIDTYEGTSPPTVTKRILNRNKFFSRKNYKKRKREPTHGAY